MWKAYLCLPRILPKGIATGKDSKWLDFLADVLPVRGLVKEDWRTLHQKSLGG